MHSPSLSMTGLSWFQDPAALAFVMPAQHLAFWILGDVASSLELGSGLLVTLYFTGLPLRTSEFISHLTFFIFEFHFRFFAGGNAILLTTLPTTLLIFSPSLFCHPFIEHQNERICWIQNGVDPVTGEFKSGSSYQVNMRGNLHWPLGEP
jgi:hypothetical protein